MMHQILRDSRASRTNQIGAVGVNPGNRRLPERHDQAGSQDQWSHVTHSARSGVPVHATIPSNIG